MKRECTSDGGLGGTASDGDVGVLDEHEVVAGRSGCVGELVALLCLRTRDVHLGRTLDDSSQSSTARLGRVHTELGWLTYIINIIRHRQHLLYQLINLL
jgi:hypothetical protein